MDNEEITAGWRFLYGVIGAISPEVVRWTKIAYHPQASDLPTSWCLYLAVFCIYAIVAGSYATMWKDNSPIKCFYFGATFIGFVAAIAISPPALPGMH